MTKPMLIRVVAMVIAIGAIGIPADKARADQAELKGSASQAKTTVALVQRANSGDARAQLRLGLLYLEGKKVPKDYRAAARWMEAAAMQRDADAQYLLSEFYREGLGVPQHFGIAFTWAQHSVETSMSGDYAPEAFLSLAVASEWGRGVRQNLSEAYKWYVLASAVSPTDEEVHDSAIRALDALRTRLDYRTIAAAQQNAERWMQNRQRHIAYTQEDLGPGGP